MKKIVSLVLATGLVASTAHGGYGLGSPVDVQPYPGDLVIEKVQADVGELRPVLAEGLGAPVFAEDLDMADVGERYPLAQLADAELRLLGVELWFRQDGVLQVVHYPVVELRMLAGCATIEGRVVPLWLVDPNDDGAPDLPVLRDWVEQADCDGNPG